MTAPPAQRAKRRGRGGQPADGTQPARPQTGPLASRIIRPAQQVRPLQPVLPPATPARPSLAAGRQRVTAAAGQAARSLRPAAAWLARWLRLAREAGQSMLPAARPRLVVVQPPRPARLAVTAVRRRPRLRPAVTAVPGQRRLRLPRPGTVAAALTWTVAGVALFACYLHMSRSVPVDSDGASNALQAWSMLHGNVLLRGWQLSDVSFYTTELPEYMLIEAVRGLTADVVHTAAALTYTLLTLTAAMVAKGKAAGGAGALRACLAAGIMLAPQQEGVQVLLLSPDHVGSAVPVLLAWLLVDRAPRRWYVPAGACLLLGLALIADNVVLLTGIGPLAFVGIMRGYQVIAQHGSRRAAGYEFSLAAAAGAALVLARLAAATLVAHGSFTVWPVGNMLATTGRLPLNLSLAGRGLLLLFGADFFGQPVGLAATLAMLHLIGLGLVCLALCTALRRLAASDVAVQLLAIGVVVSLAAFAIGRVAVNLDSAREFAAVLPFGAALAGRTLAGRLASARLVPALAAVACCYLGAAAMVAARPAVPPQNQQLTSWLAGHGLRYGLAGYWQANSVTLDSSHGARGPQVQLRSLLRTNGRLTPDDWETRPSWYNPVQHQANFLVLDGTGQARWRAPSMNSALNAFGQPARIYEFGPYIVLVWDQNLLAALARGG